MASLIGQPINRVDGPLKVTGRATYSAENFPPNTAYAVMVVSTIAKGRIASIDITSAKRSSGVVSILTHENAPKLPSSNKPEDGPASRVLQLLQDDRVLYAYQPIALAVADRFENAVEAAALVKVKYAAESHNVSLVAGLSSAYTPPKVGGRGNSTDLARGNVEAGFRAAKTSIRQVYTTPGETHNPMEPHATVAFWDKPDHLTLYDATQGVFTDRARVAQLLGLKPENVHVISPFLGGGFGSKGPTWSHVVIAAMAAKQLNRPVKLCVARTQMFGPVGHRSYTHQTVKAGAAQGGVLTVLTHDTICQTSSFDQFVESAGLSARMLYKVENNSSTHRLVKSDIGTPSYMRAPGEAPGTYALECAMDELAHELKIDPIALRLANYADSDPEKRKPWSSKSLRECYQAGADKFGWSKRPMTPGTVRDGNNLIGWGMATAVYPTNRGPASAKATLQADGMLLVDAGTQDLGTGTYTIMTQIAADSFGLKPNQVKFRLGDTDLPQTPVSGGSQTAASTGSAVRLTAEALREKLVQMAVSDSRSPLSGARSQDVVLQDGRLSLRSNPAKAETIQQLMSRQNLPHVEATSNAKPGEEKNEYAMYAFGAQFAEVWVDADLGQIKVARMLGVFGAGRILNAKTARSQLIGGMIWGIGMALLEENKMDDRLGRIVNNNLAEYHVPVCADVSEIEAICVPEEDVHVNPLGVKGVGEIGITGAAAAITNAIFNATGKRVRSLPVTADKLI